MCKASYPEGYRKSGSVIKSSTLLKPDERYEVAAWVSPHDPSETGPSAVRHDRQRTATTASDPA